MLRYLSFPACQALGLQTYDFARGDAFAKRIWATGVKDNFELVAAAGGSWRARLAAHTLAAKTRAMVWARSRGLGRSRVTLWWNTLTHRRRGLFRGGTPFQPGLTTQTELFRYGRISGLELDSITTIVDFVAGQAPASCLEIQLIESDTICVKGSDPAAEVRLRIEVPAAK